MMELAGMRFHGGICSSKLDSHLSNPLKLEPIHCAERTQEKGDSGFSLAENTSEMTRGPFSFGVPKLTHAFRCDRWHERNGLRLARHCAHRI